MARAIDPADSQQEHGRSSDWDEHTLTGIRQHRKEVMTTDYYPELASMADLPHSRWSSSGWVLVTSEYRLLSTMPLDSNFKQEAQEYPTQ